MSIRLSVITREGKRLLSSVVGIRNKLTSLFFCWANNLYSFITSKVQLDKGIWISPRKSFCPNDDWLQTEIQSTRILKSSLFKWYWNENHVCAEKKWRSSVVHEIFLHRLDQLCFSWQKIFVCYAAIDLVKGRFWHSWNQMFNVWKQDESTFSHVRISAVSFRSC